jgi:isoquinoline 1-oxidoreductase subunit alpha
MASICPENVISIPWLPHFTVGVLVEKRLTASISRVAERCILCSVGGKNCPCAYSSCNTYMAIDTWEMSFRDSSISYGQYKGISMTLRFELNGKTIGINVEADTPLLWVLRDHLGMTGTKFGCGMSLCGACTVHLDGDAVRSCVTSSSAVQGRRVTTIEGLSEHGRHPVQQAWVETEVSQCGYCQSGQIMQAAALLQQNPRPSDADIDAAMNGNLCRCGSYPYVRVAIHRAAALLAGAK